LAPPIAGSIFGHNGDRHACGQSCNSDDLDRLQRRPRSGTAWSRLSSSVASGTQSLDAAADTGIAHLAELGIVAAQGIAGLKELLKIVAREDDAAHASLMVLAAQLQAV